MSLIRDIMIVINFHSAENKSNTPDFIVAKYLIDCLEAFNSAMVCRTQWYADDAEGANELDGEK